MEKIGLKALSLVKNEAFIGGKWLSAASGKRYDVVNPSSHQTLANVPDMDGNDVNNAIIIAQEAFQKWRNTTGRERSAVLRKWFTLMLENSEDLSRIVTAESGKPLSDSRGEVTYGASFLEWFSEEAKRIYGEVPTSPSNNKEMMFIRQPIGVVGMITPWNFPVAMVTRKAGAALAAGCSCILKPARLTPLSSLAMAGLAEEAGVPPGVFNVVTGRSPSSIGGALCSSDKVAGLSFTGSVEIGKLLYQQCSSTMKKLGLELGGNAPFIVFDSANIKAAIDGLMVAKFRNAGQACVSADRIFVQAGVYDKFLMELQEAVTTRLKVGDGFADGTNIGPLIDQTQFNAVDGIVKDSIKQGAKVLVGGKQHPLGGSFYEPTILVDCEPHHRCFAEEIFGPVVSVRKFETEKEVMKLANDCRTGLCGYFYSTDVSQVFRVARQMETGMVGVNEGLLSCPEGAFGGVKESGLGREGSRHGIDDYVDIKYICIGSIHS